MGYIISNLKIYSFERNSIGIPWFDLQKKKEKAFAQFNVITAHTHS